MGGIFIVVSFQGEHGAYSEQAIKQHFIENPITLPCKDFDELLLSVLNDKADYAMLPVENTLAGTVIPAYDALMKYDLFVQAEVTQKIEHCLLCLPQMELVDVRYVISHHQALSQCRENLKKAGIEPVDFYDTAGAAKNLLKLNKNDTAAIASELAAKTYGLKILKKNFEDLHFNSTRFFVMGKKMAEASGNCKTSIIFITLNKAGALYRVLGELSNRNINMTKIESRPSRKDKWHYLFYLGFEGSQETDKIKDALKAIKSETIFFKNLGSYNIYKYD
ncbi:MAG: prephenate dehydratase [Kosmotogales bacterium]|nr:prephenate dehydratase [Kosmotogales bacterium]